MQNITIALHIGAPFTDDGQLLWSMRKDASQLFAEGFVVRRPRLYQQVLADLLIKQTKTYVSEEERAQFLSNITTGQTEGSYFISETGILGVPAWMLNGGRLFQNAGRNTGELRDLFPANKCVFILSIRNPATMVPTVFEAQKEKPWNAFLSDADLLSLRWSDVVQDILDDSPDCPILIWSNEETPTTWPDILREVTGLGADFRFKGELDIIRRIMPEQAVEKLETYLSDRPDLTNTQRHQVRGVFLDHFVEDHVVEEEIDLPGWTQELVDAMTDVYEDDIELIKQMDRVQFIG